MIVWETYYFVVSELYDVLQDDYSDSIFSLLVYSKRKDCVHTYPGDTHANLRMLLANLT